jgi:crotonobetainyl-CoA:carnitine CoA-transferase CaiB-like acyl-CoA transferase
MGPLNGLKVVDISNYTPGRYATLLFADLGAEVYGIEVPQSAKKAAFKVMDDDTMPRWVWHQRNKRSLTLDLKSDAGRKVFAQLVEKSDVVLESFKPGTTKRMGVDYEAVRKIKPDIIYCSISGFGQDGPYAQLICHEPNFQALSGLLERNRFANGAPHMSSAFLGDIVGGSMSAVIAVLAAVVHRKNTGEGQYIDVGMTAGLLPLVAYQSYAVQKPVSPQFLTCESPALNVVPEQAVYATKDGKHVGVAVLEPWLWKRACETLGCPEIIPNYLSDDANVREETYAALARVFAARTRDEWERFNFEHDIGISPVKDLQETLDDPQMLARGMVIEYDYAPVGKMKHVGVGFKMSRTPPVGIRNIPRYGENTAEILGELGYSASDIKALKDAGVC